MALSFVSSGAWTASTTSVTPAMPSGWQAGDLLVLFLFSKYDDATLGGNDPVGWTSLGGISNTGRSTGNDNGNLRARAFVRVAEAGDTAPTLSPTPNNVSAAHITAYRKTSGIWSYSGELIADDTTGTPLAFTTASNLGLTKAGDIVHVDIGFNGDAVTFTSTTAISATGATFGTLADNVADGSSSLGTDIRWRSVRRPLSSGAASSGITSSHTLGGTTTNAVGVALILRIREENDATPAVTTVASTSTVPTAVLPVEGAFDYRNDKSKYIVNRSKRAYSPVHMGNGRFVGGGGYIADPINADSAQIWAFKSATDFSYWIGDYSSSLSVQATYGGGSVKIVKINDNGVVFHGHSIGRINSTQVACQWYVVGASLYNSTTHSLSAASGRTQLQQSGGCSVFNENVYRFSDDRALVTYSHDSVTYINGFQLNSTTGAIIAQPARTTYQAATVDVSICELDESTVALAAHLSGSDIICRVLSVSSGAVVTVGADNTLAAGATALELLPIDSTHAYVIYTNATGNQVYRVLTISGNTVTFGSEALLWIRGTIPDANYGDACYLGDNKYGFLDTSALYMSTQRSWVFARDTGTNALTYESSRVVSDPTEMQDQTIFRVDDTHYGIGWYEYAGFSLHSTSAYYPKAHLYEIEYTPTNPEYLNASQDVIAAATGTTLATTSIMPSGVLAGDLIILSVAANAADTITTPTGYTPIVTAVSNASLSHAWYYRIATADASDTPTITFSTTATASHGHYARMYAFKNIDGSNPFEDATVTAVTTSSTPTGDAVATSGVDRLEVHLVAVDAFASWSGGGMPPTDFTQVNLVGSTTGGDIMMDGIYKARPTSGAGSSTQLGTMSGSHPWAVLSLALKAPTPATPATATPTVVATTSTVSAPVIQTSVAVQTIASASTISIPTPVIPVAVPVVAVATTTFVGGLSYLDAPGPSGWAQTPDSGPLSLTGDAEIRLAVSFDAVIPAAHNTPISKYISSTSGYEVRLSTAGRLFWVRSNGTAFVGYDSAGMSITGVASDGVPLLYRLAYDQNDGGVSRCTLYYKPFDPRTVLADLLDNSGWTLLGSDTDADVSATPDNTAEMIFGRRTGSGAFPMSGKIYAAVVMDGINGTVVASPDWTHVAHNPGPVGTLNPGASTTDAQGNVWTVYPYLGPGPYMSVVNSFVVGTGSTVTATVVATTTAITAPTITRSADSTPSTVATVSAVGAPTTQTGARLTPAAVATVSAVGVASLTMRATPAVVATVSTVGAAVISTSVGVQAVATGSAVNIPTPLIPVVIAPATVATSSTAGAQASAGSTVSVTAVATTSSVGTPAFSVIEVAAVVATTTGVGTPTLSTGVRPVAVVVATTSAVGASTLVTNSQVTTVAVATSSAVGSSVVRTSWTVTPALVATTSSVGAASIAVVEVAVTVATVTAVGAPTFSTGSQPTAVAVATVSAVGSPVLRTGWTQVAAIVPTATTVGVPTLSTGSRTTATEVATTSAVGASTLAVGATVTTTTVATASAVGVSGLSTGARPTPAAVASTATVGSPTLATSSSLTATSVATTTAVGVAGLRFVHGAAAVSTTSAVGVPTVLTIVSPTPVVVATVSAVGAAISQAGSTVTTVAVATVTAVGAPVVIAVTATTPAPVATVSQVGAPDVVTSLHATVPGVVVATSTEIDAPAFTAPAVAAPAAVDTTSSIGSPLTQTGATPVSVTVATASQVGVPIFTAPATSAPAAVATVSQVGTSVLATGATVTTTAVATVTNVGAPTSQTGSTVTAATVATVADVGAAVTQTGATVAGTVVATATTVGVPDVLTTIVPAPSTVATVSTVGAGASASAVLSATTVATVSTVGVPVESTGAQVSAVTVESVSAIAAPLATTGATAQPAAVATVGAVGSAGVSAGEGTSFTPASVSTVAAVDAPVISAASSTAVTAVSTLSEVGAIVASGSTPTPAAVATVSLIGVPVESAGATVSTTSVATSTAVNAAVLSAATTLTTATVPTAASIGAPAITTDVLLSAVAVPTVSSVGSTVEQAGATASPDVVATTSQIGAALSAGATVLAVSTDTVTTVGAPALATGGAPAPTAVATVSAVNAPAVAAQGNVSVSAVSVATTTDVPASAPTSGTTAAPATIGTTTAVDAPAFSGTSTTSPSFVATTSNVGLPVISTATAAAVLEVASTSTVGTPATSAGSTVVTVGINTATGVGSVALITGSAAPVGAVGTQTSVGVIQPSVGSSFTVGSINTSASFDVVVVRAGAAPTVAGVVTVTGIGTPDFSTTSVFTPSTVGTGITVGNVTVIEGGSGEYITISLQVTVSERHFTVSVTSRDVGSTRVERLLATTARERGQSVNIRERRTDTRAIEALEISGP